MNDLGILDAIAGEGEDVKPSPKEGEMNAENDVIKELLKQKIDVGYALVPRYITAFAIYAAIVATILKFALDANATQELRTTLLYLGLCISFLAMICPLLGDLLRKHLAEHVLTYHEKLVLTVPPDRFLVLRYIALVTFIFVLITISGFAYLAFCESNHRVHAKQVTKTTVGPTGIPSQ
jgi:phosphoglycerol transferase MdoB-like AlkP superfamily enzyme